jgi:Tetratricopeptide repeat
LVRIKELYYGEYSESLITALKNLGAVQYMGNKIDESIATLEKSLEAVRKI